VNKLVRLIVGTALCLYIFFFVSCKKNQYAFRLQHSTTNQLTKVTDHLANSTNREERTAAVFLDFEKARAQPPESGPSSNETKHIQNVRPNNSLLRMSLGAKPPETRETDFKA